MQAQQEPLGFSKVYLDILSDHLRLFQVARYPVHCAVDGTRGGDDFDDCVFQGGDELVNCES